ncbi:circularly permuted type 2 ATP-grasp protein, partial [Burkholderia sp. SIMBA_045]
RLLNATMADLYGPQTLLERGLLPPALVTGHPGYLRAMRGARVPGDTWLHVVAFDLARGPDGQWRIVAQHTQGAAGLGYLL